MDFVNEFFKEFSSLLWGWPMVIVLLGTHIYLTVLLRFPQRYIWKGIKLTFASDDDSRGDVSQFGALATALAATIGTGNIVGVATAIVLGGPGAVLWCWITGLFGISTKYAESLLGVKYRQMNNNDKMTGGPMYAIEKGLGMKWLAVAFAAFTVIASFGIGNTVQANAIAVLAEQTYDIPTFIMGIMLALLVAAVVIGGVKSIARFCEWAVPIMALCYVVGCVYVLCVNSAFLWPAVKTICHSAFSAQAAGGGFVGSSVMLAARYGISRGLFSNESGLGSAPIAAAAAQTRNPVRQALVASTGTFWDTVVICALTGIVLVSSVLAHPEIGHTADGATLANAAFGAIPVVGKPLLAFGMFTFAFTTIIGWSYYGERSMEYLRGERWQYVYRGVFVVSIFLGSVWSSELAWNISDCTNALMAVPNLLAIVLLSGVIVKETRHYLWENRLDERTK